MKQKRSAGFFFTVLMTNGKLGQDENEHKTIIRAGGHDGGEALGKDRGLYHPHADWEYCSAAL